MQKPYAIVNLDDYTLARQESLNNTITARTFRRMVAPAARILEAYQSDLYYDSILLREFVDGWEMDEPLKMYYAFDSSGTNLFDDVEHLKTAREHVYSVTLAVEDRTYGKYVTFDMQKMEVSL